MVNIHAAKINFASLNFCEFTAKFDENWIKITENKSKNKYCVFCFYIL